MTICNLICLDVGIIPIIFSLDHADITTLYPVACKIQFYIRHASFQMMRTYKVLACIDRFALSSMEAKIRSFSQYKIAFRLIIISGIFWAFIVIFFSCVRTIENNLCDIHNDLYLLIYTIYYLIFAGIFPPLVIIIFSLLLMRNLKRMRTHIQSVKPNGERNSCSINILRKRDRDLMKMVLIEVMIYLITTMPFSIYLIYKMLTNNSIKSLNRIEIELFFNYLTQSFLMYLNTALSFYIYICTSSSFKREFEKLIQLIKRKKSKTILANEEQNIQLHLLKHSQVDIES
jgi:hypothetical protein